MPSQTVLVVDHATDVATLGAEVTRLGYSVSASATSTREALDRAAEVRPHAVLMNAALPGVPDPIRAAAELRQRWLVPTLFVVDESDHETLRRLADDGRTGYVLRPLAERELRVSLALAAGAEHAVRAATDLEERFFDVSLDMLCCLGFDGYFRRLNAAWEHALGFTRAELMSRPFIEFVHVDDRERTLAQNRAVREGGQARLFENRYMCKDGSFRWLLWNATPDRSQHVIFSVARDVTTQKQAAMERDALVDQLQTALTEVRTLRELLPICSYCRRIRDDENRWQSIETYFARHTATRFSHGICPGCYEREVEPLFDAKR